MGPLCFACGRCVPTPPASLTPPGPTAARIATPPPPSADPVRTFVVPWRAILWAVAENSPVSRPVFSHATFFSPPPDFFGSGALPSGLLSDGSDVSDDRIRFIIGLGVVMPVLLILCVVAIFLTYRRSKMSIDNAGPPVVQVRPVRWQPLCPFLLVLFVVGMLLGCRLPLNHTPDSVATH